MSHVLDGVVWASLTGPHAQFAERLGGAVRYPAEISPFAGLADPGDLACWRDLAELVGPGGSCGLAGVETPPAGWEVDMRADGVQLVDTSLRAEPDHEAVPLGPPDAEEMLALVARTKPGPFAARTVELGGYLGIRRDGVLIAMAGQRLHPPGWTEISAVCTDDAYRGQGLGSRLVRAVAQGIRDRGETPFLHAAASNTNAIRLYESMGFTLRQHRRFLAVRAPA
jgi:ribosomal protein S18 acetylase RimI-like enzyme